jgi:hypothetical protein
MNKKLITACLGLAALAAFALPAIASASPVLTHPTGTVYPASSPTETCEKSGKGCITATNVGEASFFNAAGTMELAKCTKAIMTGTVTKNTGTLIEVDVRTLTVEGTGALNDGMPECTGGPAGNFTVTTNGTHEGVKIDEGTVASGTPYCLKSAASDKFTLRGGTCTQEARAITFITAATFPAECKYSRAAAIEGSFTTHPEDAVLSVAPGAGTTFTGEAGNSFICPVSTSLKMSLTLETDKAPAEPMYIS